MGIISLNEKRTAENPTLTTGREVSYFAADQFEFPLATPKITGHYYWRSQQGAGNGAFGVFWEDTSGNTSDLTFESTSSPTFSSNERTTATHASYTSAWSDFEVDLTGKPNGRPVFYVRRGTGSNNYKHDVCFDDFSFTTQNATTIDLDPSTAAGQGFWDTSSKNETATNYANAKNNYANVTLSAIPVLTSGSTQLVWNFRKGSTPSNDTGPDNAADNNSSTYYVYYEASSNGYSNSVGYLTWQAYRNIVTGAEL